MISFRLLANLIFDVINPKLQNRINIFQIWSSIFKSAHHWSIISDYLLEWYWNKIFYNLLHSHTKFHQLSYQRISIYRENFYQIEGCNFLKVQKCLENIHFWLITCNLMLPPEQGKIALNNSQHVTCLLQFQAESNIFIQDIFIKKYDKWLNM